MLDAVRKACLPAIWSQGVKLAREGAVTATGSSLSSGEELSFRVRAPGLAVAPTVTLYMAEGEWSCDCGGKLDPCAHVAAAAIASAQETVGPPVAGASADAALRAVSAAAARLVYRLGTRDGRLTLARAIVRADAEEPVRGSITSDLLRPKTRDLTPTHDDLRIDRIVGGTSRDFVPLDRMIELLDALSSSADVTLDRAPIRTSSERVKPRGVVEDGPTGPNGTAFVLRVEADPAATLVALGVAKVDGVLRPLGETATTGERLERLPLVRTFARSEETELVTRVIPELEKTIEVTIVTRRLAKKSVHARPRIEMDFSHHGHTLSVLPILVYGDPPIARIDGDAVVALGREVPVRRPGEERALVQRLRAELDLVVGRRVHFDGSDAARFVTRVRRFMDLVGEHDHAEIFEGRPLGARPVIDDEGHFDLLFEHEEGARGEGTDGERRRADPELVLRAWRDGLDTVPLEGGGWAPLPAAWLAAHGSRVADLLAARDPETKKLPRAALVDLVRLSDALDLPRPHVTDKLAPLLDGFERIPNAPLPEGLTATLRDYQARGVDWLAFLRRAGLGAVLADDMGLGKTLQTICAFPAPPARSLVVCPKSVVYNWEAEIARFRPGTSVAIYHGPKRAFDRRAAVTLTTYAVLRLDAEKLAAESWDTVVLDEAQAIKNESSQTARAAFDLHASFKIALSGTPVENRLEELWSVMHFANPGLLGGRTRFHDAYATPIAAGDAAAAARLRAKIRPVLLRRLKRDVLPELPPRTDVVLHVELEEAERVVYDAVRAAARKELAKIVAEGAGFMAALEALLRLRQAACHPALVPGSDPAAFTTSSKVDALLEALTDAAADGHKALVFSQWTSLLDLVEPHLEAAGVPFLRLDGSVGTEARGRIVNDFQESGGPPVLLASLKAGGTGLNLTAADHVFLLDPWWNPAAEDQAADRAHRIGQERPVMVYRLVAKDTVEERILALQEKKRALADVALGEAGGAAAITRDELLALLD
jgi:superfamily II DNA or RNA helicase